MFNLIVSGNHEAWEQEPYSIDRSRFREYSCEEAARFSLKQAATLDELVGLPTLLMYELGTDGRNARLVRYGVIASIELSGRDLQFRFTLDPQRGYLPRSAVQEFMTELQMAHFEDYRTHWAVKSGEIPGALLDRGEPTPPVRDVLVASGEYAEALNSRHEARAAALKAEIESFPPSVEKAIAYLRRSSSAGAFEGFLHLSPTRRFGRELIQQTVNSGSWESLKRDRPFSLLWLVEAFASPVERVYIDSLVEACQVVLQGSLSPQAQITESQVLPVWLSLRCHSLTLRLRRLLNTLVDRFSIGQSAEGCWCSAGAPAVRLTAMMADLQQRLGNDSHRDGSRRAVIWLCQHLSFERDQQIDIVAASLTLEAVRRSGMLSELQHITDAGDSWLLSKQQPLGEWLAQDWAAIDVVTLVFDYFSQSATVLEQVDGFLLMARDFFRKAQELAYDGGVNNRRLATIAAVHAMEMFLYGIFERRTDLGVSAYVDRGDQTLGPRESLGALQRALQSIGLLQANRQLRYRDQLSGLVGQRDMVIHRAGEITSDELERGMKAVKEFIMHYGNDLMQLDLLQ